MAKVALIEIRDLLSALTARVGPDGLSSREIVTSFKAQHKEAVKTATEELVEIALIKLLNEVARRRPTPTVVPGEGDLFRGFSIPAAVAIPERGAGGHSFRHKAFGKMTVLEASAWLESHLRERRAHQKQYEDAKTLIEEAQKFAKSPTMTVEDALALARDAKTKKGKTG